MTKHGRKIRDLEDLEKRLQNCRRLGNSTERKLLPIGLITSYLEDQHVIPIVYGGLAVEYYMGGSHKASDIDLLCTHPKRLAKVLCDAGFKKEDFEFFSHPSIPVQIQLRQDERGKPDGRHKRIYVKGYPVFMITVEESILNYTHKFIENGEPDLEIVHVADMIERYCSEIDLGRLLESAKDRFGVAHYHVLRSVVALQACCIFPP